MSIRNRCGLFFLHRSDHHRHPLPFEHRHVLGTAELLEFHGEAKQLLLSLLGKHDGTAAEEDGSLHLGPFLQEFLGMFELELEIMLVRVGAETDFLDDDFRSVGLHFLRLLPLLVQVLLVIQNLADWRISLGADLHKVQFHLLGKGERFGKGIDALFGDVVPYEAHLGSRNLTVGRQGVFVLLGTGLDPVLLVRTRRSRFERRCDSFTPL